MTKTNNDEYFYKRPPSSHSNALSEIEMNDSGTGYQVQGKMLRRNNLMSGQGEEL